MNASGSVPLGVDSEVGRLRSVILHRPGDELQWNADALRDSDEGDTSKRVSLVSTLVAAGPTTDDEAFSFVEMQGRDGDTAALGELAGRKFLGFPRRHLHGDYRSVARWRVAWR